MSNFSLLWAQVINKNKDRVLSYLNSILKCPYLAEDALQNTFLRLNGMTNKQNTEVQNPSSFCFQVARNIALDMLRQKNREKIVDLELLHLEQIFYDSTDIESEYENEQLAKKVNNTLLKLSKRHQDIISFYRSGTFKQKDIALVYQVSPTLVNFMIKEVIHSCQSELDVR